MKATAKLWLGILILALLSPLGLILPEYFKAGSAWGEWGVTTKYTLADWQEKGLARASFAYIISAGVGILAVVIVIYLLTRIFVRNEK